MNNLIKSDLTGSVFFGKKKYKFIILIKSVSFSSQEILCQIYFQYPHSPVGTRHNIIIPENDKGKLHALAENLDSVPLWNLTAEVISVKLISLEPRSLEISVSDKYELTRR